MRLARRPHQPAAGPRRPGRSSGTSASPSLGSDDARRALEPLRRQLVADRDRRPRRARRARCGGGDVRQLLARWTRCSPRPMDPQRRRAARRRPDRRRRRAIASARPSAASSTTAGRSRRRRRPSTCTTSARTPRSCATCWSASPACCPPTSRKAFVKRLKRLQDLLGEHQDAEVQAAEPAHGRRRAAERPPRRRRTSPSGASSSSSRRRATRPATGSPSASPSTTARRPGQRCARCSPASSREGPRDLQHQGRRREDDRRRQPRRRGGPRRRPGAAVGPRPAGRGDVLRPRQAAPQGRRRAAGVQARRASPSTSAPPTSPASTCCRPTSRCATSTSTSTTPRPDGFGALLEPLAGDYDVALLDCAPGITLTSEGVFDAADALLVPTIPATLSARTLEQLDRFLGRLDDPPLVLPFLSMIDRRRTVHREVAAALAAGVAAAAADAGAERRRRRADGRRAGAARRVRPDGPRHDRVTATCGRRSPPSCGAA